MKCLYEYNKYIKLFLDTLTVIEVIDQVDCTSNYVLSNCVLRIKQILREIFRALDTCAEMIEL